MDAFVTPSILFWRFRSIKGFVQSHQKLFNTLNGTTMPLDFALPAMGLSFLDEFLFNAQATAQVSTSPRLWRPPAIIPGRIPARSERDVGYNE